jgi:hypothetical protein
MQCSKERPLASLLSFGDVGSAERQAWGPDSGGARKMRCCGAIGCFETNHTVGVRTIRSSGRTDVVEGGRNGSARGALAPPIGIMSSPYRLDQTRRPKAGPGIIKTDC